MSRLWIFIMTLLFVLAFAVFVFFNAQERDANSLTLPVFPTPTATRDLAGSGWWQQMPTPLSVEAMPSHTPLPKSKTD